MMNLQQELAADSAAKCKLCAYLDTLPFPEADTWDSELAKPLTAVGNTAVVRALGRRGIVLTESGVRRHRSKHSAVR